MHRQYIMYIAHQRWIEVDIGIFMDSTIQTFLCGLHFFGSPCNTEISPNSNLQTGINKKSGLTIVEQFQPKAVSSMRFFCGDSSVQRQQLPSDPPWRAGWYAEIKAMKNSFSLLYRMVQKKRNGVFLIVAHLHTPYGSMGNLSRRKMSQRSTDSVEWFSFYANFLQRSPGGHEITKLAYFRYVPTCTGC